MAPDYASTIENVVAAFSQRPQGAALMVVGNFNNNLAAPEGQAWDEDFAAAMDAVELKVLSRHFLPRNKLCMKDGRTWCVIRQGKEVHSRTNYILGTYCCL